MVDQVFVIVHLDHRLSIKEVETMISAEKARERTEQSALLRQIEKNIKRCIKKGMYTLCMQIPASTSNELREVLRNYLYDLGYHYSIPMYAKDGGWEYDVIEISWEEKEECVQEDYMDFVRMVRIS